LDHLLVDIGLELLEPGLQALDGIRHGVLQEPQIMSSTQLCRPSTARSPDASCKFLRERGESCELCATSLERKRRWMEAWSMEEEGADLWAVEESRWGELWKD